MGYAIDLLDLIKDDEVVDNGDDQLYYTKKFLTGESGISLDWHES